MAHSLRFCNPGRWHRTCSVIVLVAASTTDTRQEEDPMSQLLVRDLMAAPVKTVAPAAPLREVIQAMEEAHVRHVPVVGAADRLVGIISHRDVLRSQEGSLSGAPSSEQAQMNRWIEARWVMTKEVRSVHPDTPALEAALILRAHGYGCVPVVDAGRLIGILTEADFVEYAIQQLSDPGT